MESATCTLPLAPSPGPDPASVRPLATEHAALLPAVAPDTARLARLLADKRLSALLMLAFDASGWSVGRATDFEAQTPGLIEWRRGGERAAVVVDLARYPALASTATAHDAPPQGEADAVLRSAVASILLDPVCEALDTLGIDRVKVAALQRQPVTDEIRAGYRIAFKIGERPVEFVLGEIGEGWLAKLEQLVAAQCMPFTTQVSQLTVPGRLQIGEKVMSVNTLRSLRPGDVILRAVQPAVAALFAEPAEPAAASVIWGSPGTRQLWCAARIDPDRLTLTGDPYMAYETHFQDSPISDAASTPVEISNLDLPIKVEIDTVSLPVAQLSALRPGYVLELPVPLREARIRLVSYGQTVGFGELVAVGDHIGVRVLQMSSQSDPV
ncbi:YscQ/HrcQ family type III secretion apparatus protein [Burkholderia sp. WAC0059]|uniref:type III secretion system cytoplasmic ring protein SctQ n=1 Tax=Burkholderia sp. WAC0059 TaxID=2066022 RepID=UPI000C7EF86F|nr:type III secretion system cytoplasmic ring protein SctQ [Burkholderia sp. WAC0059]PLZ00287.1 YscQ/HrcQ family type III secretion apparatus protein [Burkholderia sp. WAC0059]